MNEASVEGLVESGYETHEQSFLKALRHSNEVFSAFKTHSMGTLMQERLLDDKGKLRPFDEWRKSVAGIAKHYLGAWLKTEYDTAVLRAHQAADWQEFERNRDILPNLRWMPTTSPTPEEAHKDFWSRGLTLPIDDPFWADNHPANRWNCKCSLEATSDPTSNGEIPDAPKAQAGLEENPRHGHTFSDKHPYYPSSCGACPFYGKGKGKARNLLDKLFDNRKKDCYNCPYVDMEVAKAKYPEHYEKYLQLLKDKDYIDVEFHPASGGVKATHKGHKKHLDKTRHFGKEQLTATDLENECVKIWFRKGHSVVQENEDEIGKNGKILPALDLLVDGKKRLDVRAITQVGKSYLNQIMDKDKQIKRYNKRDDIVEKADALCLHFHSASMYSKSKLDKSIEAYIKLSKARGHEPRIQHLYITIRRVTREDEIIYRRIE